MKRPRLYSDWNGPYQPAYLLLCYIGTLRDLNLQKVVLKEGLEVTVYMDSDEDENIEIDGVVQFGKIPHAESFLGWYVLTDSHSFRYAKVKQEDPHNQPYALPCFQCGMDIYKHLKPPNDGSAYCAGNCPNCGLDVEHARRR